MAPALRVGKYVLRKKIGEGAFAEVRHAIHEETGEEFAVKVFDRSSMPKGDFERDVKKEVKIMQYLRHPNIVSIHAVLVTPKNMYLVMELVKGGELYDEIVSRRRIDENTSRRYFQQLVDAMVYCHRRGVVHRDLKPENLLVDGNGNLKVTDFGMSWMKENVSPEAKANQLLRTQCGTPKYMAPEVIMRPSDGYDGEKFDAWECGMVLYALLAGYLPFAGEDESTVFRSILRGKVRFPSHFSPGCRDILLTLLEKDPEKRASLEEVRRHPWFLVNYNGDPLLDQATEATLSPMKGSAVADNDENTASSPECTANHSQGGSVSNDASFAQRNCTKSLSEIPGKLSNNASERPPLTVEVAEEVAESSIWKRGKGLGGHRKGILSLDLKSLFSSDPFETELKEVELPGTPSPGQWAKKRESFTQNTTSSTPKAGNEPNPKGGTPDQTSPTSTKGIGKKVLRPPPITIKSKQVPRRLNLGKNIGSGSDDEDEEAPVSFKERIGTPIANVFRTLRSGIGPSKNDKSSCGDNVEDSSWFNSSSSPVTATSSPRNEKSDPKFNAKKEMITVLEETVARIEKSKSVNEQK